MVTHVFGNILGQRVSSIILPVHPCSDVRVWRASALPRVPLSDLYSMINLEPQRRLSIGWIWTLGVHPRVTFFLWKVAWRHLLIRTFLMGKGLHMSPFCPACGLDSETLEHVLFLCPRACRSGRW